MTAITAVCLVLSTTAVVLLSPPADAVPQPEVAPPPRTATVRPEPPRQPVAEEAVTPPPSRQVLTALGVPADASVSAATAATYVQARPELARQLTARRPSRAAGAGAEAQLAAAVGPAAVRSGADSAAVRRDAVHRVFAGLPREERDWLAVSFPETVGNLPGAPFAQRALANRIRVAAALAEAQATPPAPPVPAWRHWWPFRIIKPDPPLRGRQVATYREILRSSRQLLFFDQHAAGGRGAWVELVGALGPHTTAVGLLVPGGSAYLTGANFDRYHTRAANFVAAAPGSLAMVVWAAGDFPSGWAQESMARYDGPLGRRLAAFSHELRTAIADAGSTAQVTAIGHSYGGAVVGDAELRGLSVDRVLHIASAGAGAGVRSAADYPVPDRPRYSMTAPGDWISYVQGLSGPVGLGLGHGSDPDTTPGFVALSAGSLPADPTSPDEFGDPIGALAATAIDGRRAHSTIFIPHSDAWQNMYRVMVGGPLHVLPPLRRYSAPADPSLRLPFAPLAGSLARSCHYTRRPGGPRSRPARNNPLP